MATIITETIGSSSRDYATISAWNDATKVLDLVALDQVRVGVIYNDSDFTESSPITFSGATTDSTRYRKLTVAEGHRHLGRKTQGANLTYTGTADTYNFLTISEPYFKLEWLRLHRETSPTNNYGGNIIYCPGSSSPKYITLNALLIHDWLIDDRNSWEGPHANFYAIYIYQNGGCKVFNSFITNLLKQNDDGDDMSQGGIIISNNTTTDNYIYNNTVTNIQCTSNFMKASGGIGIYGTNQSKTHVKNCLSSVRRYVYDQSSIPNGLAEDYSFDFAGTAASDSDYNCERGGLHGATGAGYKQSNFVPGVHSLTGQDPFDVFIFPDHDNDFGNGFYGYGFHVKGNPPSTNPMYGLHNDTYIYQVAPGESGKITFTNMFVFEMVAGYRYVDADGYGALTELKPDGYGFNDGTPTRTLNGVFSYNRTANTFTQDSGDVELASAIEMVDGLIRFKTNYITTDWSTLPAVPTGGGYVPADAPYNQTGLVLIKDHFTGPAILMIGSQHNNSFHYTISDRILSTEQNAYLKIGSSCVGTGVVLDLVAFPELTYDITGKSRA